MNLILRLFFLLLLTTSLRAEVIRIGVSSVGGQEIQRALVDFTFKITHEVAQQRGWTLQVISDNWDNTLKSLETGKVDIVFPIVYSIERAAVLDFSKEPMYVTWGRVFALKNENINSILDLDQKKIARVTREIFGLYLELETTKFGINVTYQNYPDTKAAVESVLKGETHAIVMENIVGNFYRKSLIPSSVVFYPMPLLFATLKGRGEKFLPYLDAHIKLLKKDTSSIYYEYYDKWFMRLGSPQYLWLFWFFIGVLIFLLISAFCNYFFKMQVKRKTEQLLQKNKELLAVREELEILNKNLQKHVEQRTLDLEITNRELESFSYSVSHDLRAPLRSIDGFSLALLEDYGDQLDEGAKKYLKKLRSSSQNMTALIESLLKISRLNQKPICVEEVNISQIAIDVMNDLKEQNCQDRSVDFICEPNLIVLGDRQLLMSVMRNLLENSWKYTIHKEKAILEFRAFEEQGEKIFFVRDNGVGFNMDYIDKLFGPFQRLHHVEEYPGVGVGLAIVQRVIHRHKGRVWAESSLNRGATFYFTLNLTKD